MAQRSKSSGLDFSCWPSQPSDQVLSDWLAMRKSKKAPVSQTVINRLAKKFLEAEKQGYTVDDCLAECVVRGWRGFDLAWLLNDQNKFNLPKPHTKTFVNNSQNVIENNMSIAHEWAKG